MLKLKTNSSAKKRFKITKNKKVIYKHIGKRHGMVKRSNSQIRKLRKAAILSESNAHNIKKKLLPYG